MARVTIEDCIKNVPNRYKLVLMAARRARDLGAGAPACLDEEDLRRKDKNTVVALREIADHKVDMDTLEEEVVSGFQKFVPAQETEADEKELKEVDAELSGLLAEDASMDTETVTDESELSDAFEISEEPTEV